MSNDRETIAAQAIEQALGAGRAVADVDTYRIAEFAPSSAAKPDSVDELSAVMREAHAAGLTVAPFGGGTRMTLGNVPVPIDLAIDLTALDGVVSHSPADLTGTFQAGMTISNLQRVLADQGQFLPLDAPLPDRATIGGTLAAGVSGPLKWQFGNPRDLVIGMKVVQADGSVVKSGGQVVKNVSGYDMARLHIGGLGSLGIIAEVSFKLTPLPANEQTVIASFETGDLCGRASMALFRSHLPPLALTSFDQRVASVAGLHQMAGDRFLAIRFGGRPRTLERLTQEAKRLSQESGASGIETLEGGDAEDFWRKLSDFGWRPEDAPRFAIRISVLPSETQRLIDTISSAQFPGLEPAVVAHPGYGNVMAYWFPDESETSHEADKSVVESAWAAAASAGGSAIIERCPAELKARVDVWGAVGGPRAIMERLKEQYDPDGVLNPGRFVGGM